MSGEMSWYIARTGGLLAWALSAVSILWGLLITSRALGKRISGPRLLDLHRFIGGLSVIFVVVHIVGLRLNKYEDIDFGFKELLVPMASDWHPGAVAYGIVAFYLLIAVELTSLLRRKLPSSLWRRLHYSGFVVFLLGSIHALKVGTDVQNPLIWWPSAVLCAAIVGLGVTRAMAAAQAARGDAADVELEIFGTPGVVPERVTDQWAVPASAAPVKAATPAADAVPTADPVAQALATTAVVDDNRAALLERTRRSLENLDITAYPRAELPPEMLTTRPVQSAMTTPDADRDDVVLPVRPATDIALRYARLRNPTNAPAAAPPSFQALIPPGANSQSNWGQPPAGWDAPSATPTAQSSEVNELAAPAPAAEPPAVAPAPIGLPDPNSRTPWQEQVAPQVSSLDWRTPTRAADTAALLTPPGADLVPELPDREPQPSFANTRSGLPSRTPQRLARSTQPARNPLDWKPQRLETMPMGGAPPPPTPDPVTGEVPSEQYRVWLREWLAFAESYDG
ncbi:MAG TPA: ferric reductase-like transmembrane domain-containing protein [Acidimicrobiales bacterium]|nr:ferric reductase-like transmembrane domain-containing protein [Acidimicrobiales bacterium]